MTLAKGYSQYGADMGRRSDVFPADLAGDIRALELHLDNGGYDSGGAYWGIGDSLWRLTAEHDGETLVRYVRAKNFEALRASTPVEGGELVKEIGADRLDEFVLQYERSARWSSTDDDGKPLDAGDDPDLADETRAVFRQECEVFLRGADMITSSIDDGMLAHDFWLTRTRAGVCFLDRGYPEEIAEKLNAFAEGFGAVSLYVGDDGKVYQV